MWCISLFAPLSEKGKLSKKRRASNPDGEYHALHDTRNTRNTHARATRALTDVMPERGEVTRWFRAPLLGTAGRSPAAVLGAAVGGNGWRRGRGGNGGGGPVAIAGCSPQKHAHRPHLSASPFSGQPQFASLVGLPWIFQL